MNGIGPFIAEKLEKRVQAYIREGGVFEGYVGVQAANGREKDDSSDVENGDNQCLSVPSQTVKSVKPRAPKEYIPTFRSGPYAMLLALYRALEAGQEYLTREQIVQKGQTHCSVVMDEGTFSAVSGAIATLTKKSLVRKLGVPPKYSLTQEGVDLARKLLQGAGVEVCATETSSQSMCASNQDTLEPEMVATPLELKTFTWKANTYDVHLVMDNREVKSQRERDFFIDRLRDYGIICEQRPLVLADIAWIAKRSTGQALRTWKRLSLTTWSKGSESMTFQLRSRMVAS